jgi:hypothetical protein
VKAHGLSIGIGQYQAHGRIALRAYPAKEIGRLGLLLPHDSRPGSLARPQPGLGAALANAHFVLKPDIDLVERDIRGKNGLHFLDEVFLNSACLAGLACGLTARADIHTMSNRLSSSYTPFSV